MSFTQPVLCNLTSAFSVYFALTFLFKQLRPDLVAMDELVAAAMPQPVRVLFDFGATVLVNDISPSTQFQVVSSAFDAQRSSTAYHLKPKSGTKQISVIAAEDKIALAGSEVVVNTEADVPPLYPQRWRDERELGQMINLEDVECGDTIETSLDSMEGFTRALNVGKKPGLDPYFEYHNVDGHLRFCFNQRVRLLAKSTAATRSSCIPFEKSPPVYRCKHPRYDELRFGMLGLLHARHNSCRLSEALIRRLQTLGISRKPSRKCSKAEDVVTPNAQVGNAEHVLLATASRPAELGQSNKIEIGDLVEVATQQGRPYKGKVARKVLLSGSKPSPTNLLGQGPRGPGFKVVGIAKGKVQNFIEERVKLIRKGTRLEIEAMLARFPPCENEDFDIDEFEAQVAATDAEAAAKEEEYMMQKYAEFNKTEAEADEREAQKQRSRGNSVSSESDTTTDKSMPSEAAFGVGDIVKLRIFSFNLFGQIVKVHDDSSVDVDGGDEVNRWSHTFLTLVMKAPAEPEENAMETGMTATVNEEKPVFASGTTDDSLGGFHIGDRVKPKGTGSGRTRVHMTSYRWERGAVVSILYEGGQPTRLGVKKGYLESITFCLPEELEYMPDEDGKEEAAKDFKLGDLVLVLDARLAGVWKGRIAKVNDPEFGAVADGGKTFDVVPGSDIQTIAGIKIRGELLGVSAADMQLIKKSVSKSKRVKDSSSRKTAPRW